MIGMFKISNILSVVCWKRNNEYGIIISVDVFRE